MHEWFWKTMHSSIMVSVLSTCSNDFFAFPNGDSCKSIHSLFKSVVMVSLPPGPKTHQKNMKERECKGRVLWLIKAEQWNKSTQLHLLCMIRNLKWHSGKINLATKKENCTLL